MAPRYNRGARPGVPCQYRDERDSPRDRRLIPIAALVMGGSTEQLPGHLQRGLDNGLTPLEISEILTHLAFYAGWPKALSAVTVARRILEPDEGRRRHAIWMRTSPSSRRRRALSW